jgi:hypothetical protein
MAYNTSSKLVSGSANLTISGGEASLTTNTSITASAAAATATVTINSGKPSAGQTIVLISTDGTSKTYTAVAGSATVASNQFSVDNNHDDVAFSLETAIEHSSGHNGKILVSRTVNVLALTQAVAGSGGNSSITTNMSNTEADAAFVGGSTGAVVAAELDISGDIDIDGTTNLDDTDIDGTLVVDGSNISLDSTSTLNIDNSNTSNGITIGTATSGVPISIGHSTSEVTVNDNLSITGKVGIGTASPSNALEIEGSSGDLIIEIDNNASNSANFQIQNGAGNARVDLVMNDGTANTTITMKGQKVGIGDTSPSYTLDVGGNAQIVTDLLVGDDLSLTSDSSVINMGVDNDVTLTHDGTTGLTIAATPISIDSTGALDLNSTTGDINFQDGGTNQLALDLDGTAGEIIMKLMVDSDDFVFKQYDGTEVFRVEDNGDFDIAGGAGSTGVTVTAAGQLTADGRVIVDNTTDATSATDGSLQTDGGLSVAKDVIAGNDVKLLSDSAVLSLGAGSDATLTHDGTTGLTIAATPISIDSTGALDLNSTTGDINFQDGGTNQLALDLDGTSGEIIMKLMVDSDDFVFKQYDGTEVFRVEDNGDFDIAGGLGSSGVTVSAAGAISADGRIITDDSTAATSTTDGSIQTDGGLSVALDAVVGDDLILLSDSAVIHFGADKDTTLTHTDGTGLTLNSTNKLCFNDASQFIQGASATVMEIGATDEIGLTATLVDMDANLDLDGTANISGLLTIQTGIVPDAQDGAYLGTSSLQWSDLFLADGAVISFGDDNEITLTHVADDGLILKHVGTGDGKEPSFSFHAGDNDIAADDVLGSIFFKAPDEGAGTDAILVAAGIEAVSEGDFSSSNNATKLSFKTGASEAATEKVTISSEGNLNLVASNTELRFYEGSNFVGFEAPALSGDQIWVLPAADGSNGQQLTTDGSGTLSWASAGSGGDGTMKSIKLNNSAVGDADIVTLDFSSNFTATESPNTEIQIGIAAAQTTITSIFATDVKIGEDDQTKIDFETADEIHFYAANAQEMIVQANVVAPGADDGTALGDANQRWSDLFLASGAVINFDNGDVTLTHSSNTLTAAGGTVATAALTTSTIVASGIVKTDDTTNATSTTDGSLQTDGGLSVVLDAVFGDDVALLSDAAVLNFGANAEIKLTHVHDTGLLLTDAGGTPTLQFHDANESISSDGGHLIFTSNGVSFDFPSADGSDGQQLTTDGNGVLTWAAAGTASGAQTAITTILNTGVKIGRDSENLIDFATTDNKIIFRVNNVNEVELVENALSPVTSDGVALGTTSLMWSDLFVASGGVLNFNNGDMTVTHSSNTLTVAGGTLATAALTASTGTFSGILKTDDATDATSTTDGSLQTDGGLSVVKDAVIGDDLIMLSDAAVMHFGTNSEITLTHVHDTGLTITNTINGTDNRPCVLQLKSEEDAIVLDDVIASIEFAAGDSDGTDGATVAAGIHAIAEGTFSASANATSLVFTTGVSETAASSANAKMKLSSGGDLTVFGDTHTFSSSNTTDPLLIIKNTTNDAGGARLRFVKDKGAAGADNDIAGQIEFYADDDNQDNIKFGGIEVLVKDASNGAEGGEMILTVATHDGENQPGLVIADGDLEDEVDVNLGNGTLSTTTSMGYMKATSGFLVPEGKSLHVETPMLATNDHAATGITTLLTASEAIAQFDLVYISGNGTIAKADADAIATMPAIGMAVAAISNNAAGVVLLQGFVRDDTFNFTAGNRLFVSTTAGGITATVPSGNNDVAQAVGVATSDDTIYFSPDMTCVEITA